MEEPITLKTAEEKLPEFLTRKADLEYLQRQHLINDLVIKLNNIITERIEEIKIKPIVGYLQTLDFITVQNEINALYPEFAILSGGHSSVSIKLADKDWDWLGYGIKEVPKEKQKSFWQKLWK